YLYTMERGNGAMVMAKPYMDNVNWTKGIDQKTGKPLDYDPTKDIQVYSTLANQNPREPTKKVCPGHAGGNNYWPSSYSQRTKLIYIPALSNCEDITIDTAKHSKDLGWNGGSFKITERYTSDLTAADPVTGKQYVAIASGPTAAGKSRLVNTPELRDMRHATVLYVFGL